MTAQTEDACCHNFPPNLFARLHRYDGLDRRF
jgi:hypothetical protein